MYCLKPPLKKAPKGEVCVCVRARGRRAGGRALLHVDGGVCCFQTSLQTRVLHSNYVPLNETTVKRVSVIMMMMLLGMVMAFSS